ncbi:MAG: hypothetical protein K0R24_2252 [Gammaproteobacteria bacterium]|jgi:hypothetical protein|nr:hypothetical protein [Gammaproteobacteria bacterium]
MNLKIDIASITIFPDGRLDVNNAAAYLGLSAKTLASMRGNGRGPKFIKRGRIFYFRDDLDAWLKADGKFCSTTQVRSHNAQVNPQDDASKALGQDS